jgi:hypothetical protein
MFTPATSLHLYYAWCLSQSLKDPGSHFFFLMNGTPEMWTSLIHIVSRHQISSIGQIKNGLKFCFFSIYIDIEKICPCIAMVKNSCYMKEKNDRWTTHIICITPPYLPSSKHNPVPSLPTEHVSYLIPPYITPRPDTMPNISPN